MPTSRWTVKARLTGQFALTGMTAMQAEQAVLGLLGLHLEHEYDAHSNDTGARLLTLKIELEHEDAAATTSAVADRATETVETIASLIALSTGRSVQVQAGSMAAIRDADLAGKGRLVTIGEGAELSPPSILDGRLLGAKISEKERRVIRWWSHGANGMNSVDRLMSLNNALDLMAGMEEGSPARERTCEKCGFTKEIGPGLKERVVQFLTRVGACDATTADRIYQSRLDLAHAGSRLQPNELREYQVHAQIVSKAIRAGLAHRLGVDIAAIALPSLFDGNAAIIDVSFEVPSSEDADLATKAVG